ncbi:MAG: deoxyguanosinetriphosphate triphosphohydrolase [Candidatus Margulisiibacteriota bacterium]|nr:MAG: hypothetical protein A2X43_09710 [Candidatus Margulisbacteria bacterium GWD2_39_127]OGI04600.1 MAG: hypothetical protein A2X42_07820 [Candidatus Margulisbacteria bacterium GWF2_38_17]OGI11868.1 MAG: hypothetical protein A2X41_11450 [Candidatus Margulisbacteria bacterium GWE2_39_32]PZM83121.1 MAG: deoxyguanosinetriphosphate triphosphohydrolase [Candidatus Margulisiibacteriota bacterium]HAR62211.1 deoxyguanosinetriphosphate triphosphohydrolase [Candidatus Margulisiibacteriota bacterium]
MRTYFENLEREILAPYALKSSLSVGRKFDEQPDEYRTCFQRDRDRIIHSKAFRRLKQKTQVFIVSTGDHYRTRLTHSLEVAQISRQIGRMLRLNEDVVESIALAHDLGHTPFGHVGEEVLDELLKSDGGFEHNRQSRRILEVLEHRYPNFPGLNISFEILDGLIKHKTPYDKTEYTESHRTLIMSLESQVVNIADEIAYNNHDLDDGITSGIISMAELERDIELWKEASRINRDKYTNITAKELHRLNISTLIGMQVVDVYTTARALIESKNISSAADIKTSLVAFSSQMKEKNEILRKYLYKNFYKHPDVEIMNQKGARIIRELFQAFSEYPKLFPQDASKFDEHTSFIRQIGDYIALMTDNFAEETLRSTEVLFETGKHNQKSK